MSHKESTSGHKKIVEFIPYKTMAMDLESILASLTRMYVGRNDASMVELLSLSQPELFPVGSFDDEAERYEYVLKLAVPAKFHHQLRDNIDKIRPQLLADIGTVTAPYLHEIISEVFVVLKIEQDPAWREAAMEWVMEGCSRQLAPEIDALILCAPADENGVARELASAFESKRLKVATRALVSLKSKDIQHVLDELDKRARFGVLVVSRAMTKLPFGEEAREHLVAGLLNPGKRLCQMWDQLERPDVASFHPALARSLAPSTVRMSMAQIGDLLAQSANLG